MKIEIYKGRDKKFYVRFTAKNGRKLMQSEGYNSRASARNCVASVRRSFNTENWSWDWRTK